jgi:hypothetical protein
VIAGPRNQYTRGVSDHVTNLIALSTAILQLCANALGCAAFGDGCRIISDGTAPWASPSAPHRGHLGCGAEQMGAKDRASQLSDKRIIHLTAS